MHHCDDSWRRVTMTRRCIQAVFAAFLIISVFQAGSFENVTTSLVNDQWLNVADTELLTSQISATEDVNATGDVNATEDVNATGDVNATADVDVTEAVSAVETDSWKLLERVRLFSTMTTSYDWSARFDDRDREKTLTVVFSYRYIAGRYDGTINVKQAGGYLTAAIDDFCRRPGNNRLKDYYFE